MAQALTPVSWAAVILGIGTAIAITLDLMRHPQPVKIMNAVWPITGLYLPVAGWWLYADMARLADEHGSADPARREILDHAAVAMEQDKRLTCPAFNVVEANASHFDEFPHGRIITFRLLSDDAVPDR